MKVSSKAPLSAKLQEARERSDSEARVAQTAAKAARDAADRRASGRASAVRTTASNLAASSGLFIQCRSLRGGRIVSDGDEKIWFWRGFHVGEKWKPGEYINYGHDDCHLVCAWVPVSGRWSRRFPVLFEVVWGADDEPSMLQPIGILNSLGSPLGGKLCTTSVDLRSSNVAERFDSALAEALHGFLSRDDYSRRHIGVDTEGVLPRWAEEIFGCAAMILVVGLVFSAVIAALLLIPMGLILGM